MKMKRQNIEITCFEGTSLHQNASFEPLYDELALSVWHVQVRKKKRQEGKS